MSTRKKKKPKIKKVKKLFWVKEELKDPSLNTSLADIKTRGYGCNKVSLEKCLKEVKKPEPRRILEILLTVTKIKDMRQLYSFPVNVAYEKSVREGKEIRDKIIKEILDAIVKRDTEIKG